MHRQSIHDPAVAPAEQREAGRAYTHAVALASIQRLGRAAEEIRLLPREWADASTYSDFLLWLTSSDVDRVRTEIFDVIQRYRQDGAGSGAGRVPVSVQVQAFPVPGTLDLEPGPA